jgi:hypothetical protein
MAVLITIFGVASAVRTPTDIFPNIDIPVVSVVFSYTGLPPDDMTGRVVTFYERALTTSVNDIEHIESQSIPGVRDHQDLLPADREHQRGARTTTDYPTARRQAPGLTPTIRVKTRVR